MKLRTLDPQILKEFTSPKEVVPSDPLPFTPEKIKPSLSDFSLKEISGKINLMSVKSSL